MTRIQYWLLRFHTRLIRLVAGKRPVICNWIIDGTITPIGDGKFYVAGCVIEADTRIGPATPRETAEAPL